MMPRIQLEQVEPNAYQAVLGLEKYLANCDLDSKLLSLIKIKASQINKCAFCLNMHVQEAKKLGESDRRLHALNAWQDTSWFTPQERVALSLTEAVTLIADNSIDDELYQLASSHFSANQLGQILMAICTINTWNRIAITTKMSLANY